MRVVAFIHDRTAVEKILRHVGLSRDRPARSSARATASTAATPVPLSIALSARW